MKGIKVSAGIVFCCHLSVCLLVLRSEQPQFTHGLATVVAVWGGNISGKPLGECPGSPLTTPRSHKLWLTREHHRVDTLPSPGVESRSPLWKPQLTLKKIATPHFFSEILTTMSPRISQYVHGSCGVNLLANSSAPDFPNSNSKVQTEKIRNLYYARRRWKDNWRSCECCPVPFQSWELWW